MIFRFTKGSSFLMKMYKEILTQKSKLFLQNVTLCNRNSLNLYQEFSQLQEMTFLNSLMFSVMKITIMKFKAQTQNKTMIRSSLQSIFKIQFYHSKKVWALLKHKLL